MLEALGPADGWKNIEKSVITISNYLIFISCPLNEANVLQKEKGLSLCSTQYSAYGQVSMLHKNLYSLENMAGEICFLWGTMFSKDPGMVLKTGMGKEIPLKR